MTQILHIFRKDARHHWPEILVSLALLVTYGWRIPVEWRSDSPYGAFLLSGSILARGLFTGLIEYLPLLLFLSYGFLILRVVHDERLVGHNQFWITRPYEWPKLLAAKLLFILIFVNLPILAVQLVLLPKAGFPIAPNLPSLAGAQLGVFIVLVWIVVTLSVITSSLGRAILTVIGIFFVLTAATWLVEQIPNAGISVDKLGTAIEEWTMFLAPAGAILWQYARRRTWHARDLLLGAGAFLLLVNATRPYAALIAEKYPLDASPRAPVHLAFQPEVPRPDRLPSEQYFPGPRTILIPVAVSGIQQNSVVQMNGIHVRIEEPKGFHWDPGWKSAWAELWPETNTASLRFEIDNRMFQQIKAVPVTLRISVALSEFHEAPVGEVTVLDREFSVPGNGFCHLNGQAPQSLSCRVPAPYHSLVATALVSPACGSNPDVTSAPSQKTGHYLRLYEEDFVTPLLSPIETPYISFEVPTDQIAAARNPFNLCPGTIVHLATPILARTSSVELLIGPIALEGYDAALRWSSYRP